MTTPTSATTWTPIAGVDYGAAVAQARHDHPTTPTTATTAHQNPGPYSWMDSPAGWGEYLRLFAGDAAQNYVAEGNAVAGVADTVGTTASHLADIITFLARPLGQIMLGIILVALVWHWWAG